MDCMIGLSIEPAMKIDSTSVEVLLSSQPALKKNNITIKPTMYVER